jgi:hypothetical protein
MLRAVPHDPVAIAIIAVVVVALLVLVRVAFRLVDAAERREEERAGPSA